MSVRSVTLPRQGEEARAPGLAWYDALLSGALFLSFLASLYTAFVYAPTEAVQGDTQRIFYFHMAIATFALFAFFVVFVASILYLWRREPRWDIYARSSAEVGVLLTTLTLITGSLWGRPIWGTWWTWDARLTTTLILWVTYVAYFMLRSYSADRFQGARNAAVLGIIGFVDVPIVYESVYWWRTLHPQPVITLEGSAMPPAMLVAMFAGLIAFTLFYVWIMRQRVRLEWLKEEIEALRDAEE